jgi:hypothetical protein
MNRNVLLILLRAWFLIAVIDGVFASLMSMMVYGGTFSQLWQGVASTLLGASARQGGARTVLIGLAMHAGVALLWSTMFLLLVLALPTLRRTVATWGGIVAVAAVYGPAVWMIMSFLVIPRLTGRPPMITGRWWANFFSHIPFVALPIVATIGRGLSMPEEIRVHPTASTA